MLTRLRLIGWVPWAVFGIWAALAAAQEPRMLRGFGVHLLENATWAGGAVMATLLLLIGGHERRSAPGAALANVLLVLLVALAQASLCVCFDLVFSYAPRAFEALKSATYLVVAWFPVAIALSSAGQHKPQDIIWKILIAVSTICSVAVAVDLWRGGFSSRNVAAAVLAATGSLLLSRSPQR